MTDHRFVSNVLRQYCTQVSIWFPALRTKGSRLIGCSRLECGSNYYSDTSEKHFLQICTCLDKGRAISAISTLWLGRTVQQGSASRDYSLQCDRPSYLLRVMRGRFCHSALAQSHMARSTYWACCWLWNQLLTWFTKYDCFTSQTFFPGSGIKFWLDRQTVSEGRRALPDNRTQQPGFYKTWWSQQPLRRKRRRINNCSHELQRHPKQMCEKLKKARSLVWLPTTWSGSVEQLCHCRLTHTHTLLNWWRTKSQIPVKQPMEWSC